MVVLANPLFRAIGSFIDRRRSINDYETVGHEYTFEVRCLQQHVRLKRPTDADQQQYNKPTSGMRHRSSSHFVITRRLSDSLTPR